MEKPKKHSLDFEKPLHALELQLEEIQNLPPVRTLIFSEIKAIEAKIEKTKGRFIQPFSMAKVQLSSIPTAHTSDLTAGH